MMARMRPRHERRKRLAGGRWNVRLSLLSLLVGLVYKRTSRCVRRYVYVCVRAVFVKNSSAQSK